MASPLLELTVFACGNGDTILVKWNGPSWKWGIIDCHLPHGRIRDKVFDRLDREGIRELEFICLTHPDLDHLLGMADLVAHFTTGGRRLKHFCHPPTDSKTIAKILFWSRKETARSEYRKLIETLQPLLESREIKRLIVSANAEPVAGGDQLMFIPIAPDGNTDFKAIVAGLKRLSKAPLGNIRVGDVNAISIVLVASGLTHEARVSILLAGDLCIGEWPWAIEAWERKAKANGCNEKFCVIKVPHHGSIDAHEPRLAKDFGDSKPRYTVISVGDRFPEHPDRRVLSDFAANDWQILLTMKRKPYSYSHPFDLSSRVESGFHDWRSQDITVLVHADGRIEAGPPEAFLARSDISLYDTAKSRRAVIADEGC